MQDETGNASSGMEREGIDPGTPPQDTGLPDQVETDLAALNSAEHSRTCSKNEGDPPRGRTVRPGHHQPGPAGIGGADLRGLRPLPPCDSGRIRRWPARCERRDRGRAAGRSRGPQRRAVRRARDEDRKRTYAELLADLQVAAKAA